MTGSWAGPTEMADAGGDGNLGGAPRLRRHRVSLLLSACIVIVSAVAGWSLWAMRANEMRAQSWERRAAALQKDESQLQSVLSARTRLLNQRIDQVNTLATKLSRSQVALGQSQGDVTSLETRQREFANEKAQLQDQQAALDQVAGDYVSCKQDLIQLLSDVANAYDTSYDYSAANTDCSTADSSLQGYLSTWPNG